MTRMPASECAAAESFVAHDPRFRGVLGTDPRLVRVVQADAHEGPVYIAAEDALYFTSVPRWTTAGGHRAPLVAIRRLACDGDRLDVDPERVTTVVADANAANGMTLAPDGRLLVCEQGSWSAPARISRLTPAPAGGETIADGWNGRPLNSPNDAVVGPDGAVWFTDPSYGYLQGFRPEPRTGDHVYRVGPDAGDVELAADGLDKPNGLAFSPDGDVLYVGDSGANQEPGSYHPGRPHHVVAFDVRAGRLERRRRFAEIAPGFPDGIKVDSAGRVYVSSWSGVQVFEPDGERIGEIRVPGAVNFVFGGLDRNVLFITADAAIWAAVLDATGPPPWSSGPAPHDQGD